jgi:hypothetical protein
MGRQSMVWFVLPLCVACSNGNAGKTGDEGGEYGGDGGGIGGGGTNPGGTDAGGGDGGTAGGAGQGLDPQEVISRWGATPMGVASDMMTKYGDPDEVTDSMLVWHDNGDFLHTIVFRDEIRHDFPTPHTDLLEQFIGYRVPPELFDDLAGFNGSVMVERTTGLVSARCDKEGANYLALNLVNDIVTGQRTWMEARQFYGEQISLFLAGEDVPYMDGLMFTPDAEPIGDPDTSTIPAVGGGDAPAP